MRASQASDSLAATLLLAGVLLGSCSEEAAQRTGPVEEGHPQEAPRDAGRAAEDLPSSSVATQLSLSVDETQRSATASARLQREPNGRSVFSAYSEAASETFSLRLAIPSNDRPLRDVDFTFEAGVPQESEITWLRGELPNATSLRSVSGTLKFKFYAKENFELTFDVELSRDPFGGGDKLHATGTLQGGVEVVCLKEAEPGAMVQVQSAEACRELLGKLEA
jgi:hypothetical protein